MNLKPRKIIDPRTGKERVVGVEEQLTKLEKGVLFDAKIISKEEDGQNFPADDRSRT